ncbi:ABC transporter ATP-binding protein [Leptolyngbya sp. 15MV]|nr:ABC transporter ATP-binding protein [Leptolyngbya sp. 15MV]
MTAPLLTLSGVHAGYGPARVLFGVDLEVREGEVVALLGRNGMGKTTTIRTVMGQLRATAGQIRFAGHDLARIAPHRIARLGIGLVPEGRHIFASLSVEENLTATARDGDWTAARVYALFPRLRERRLHGGGKLSGGEQQMLAIGRALMTNPRLLILDEATEGLAPVMREEIWRCLAQLRAERLAVLVIDKNLARLARLADRFYAMENGRIAWQGGPDALRAEREAVTALLAA